MSEQIEEREPTQDELDMMAAKQLLIELSNLKQHIYKSKMLVTGMLIVQVRFVINGLVKKYNEAGMLVGETVNVSYRNPNFIFEYSPRLKTIVAQIHKEATQQEVK